MSNYHIKHLEEYYQVYRKSIREPESFWEEIAEEHFLWRKKWDSVLDWDLDARIVSPSSSLPTVEVIFIKPQNSNLL